MYSYNYKPKIVRAFNILWRCLVAVGIMYVCYEVKYIADLMTGYVRMILQGMGSF